MKLSSESKFLINQVITTLIEHYSNQQEEVVTDIYFQPSGRTGELKVFNDDDEELAQAVISEFEGLTGPEVNGEMAGILRRALDHKRKQLEALPILKPFSFVLVDEDKETLEDLMLVDDELLLADEGLLAGLDEELNDFLKKLLED